MGRIFNFKIYIKKYISTFISILLIYFQVIFSFAITSSIISAISIKQSYAYNEIIPPQNIKDNPIDHITPDNSVNIPRTNNNTHLDRTQNGTPMVNINNANNQGISANYYKDFNVDNQNLILNNHKGEAVNTQLGGVVYGNPNFNNTNGREADIILNEITTNRISNINGYIEVAGKRADVIIANPNGIMVGGAGFINTNRLSMITGSSLNQNTINGTKSSFDQNSNLNPFLLTDTNKNPNAIIQVVGRNITDNQGNIVAYNLGIDAQDVRYADLISRVVKINGNIHGNIIQTEDKPFATEVNIKTGNDRAYYNTDENGNKNNKGFNVKSTVNYQPSTVNCEAEVASHKPEFAIDSTAFGGIYAGRINFIATENGVGVRTRSDLIASTDDINFDVNGNIILEEEGSLYAKRDINLNNKTKAENKNNNNTNPSNKTTAENKNNTITNKSTIAAENNININTDELINSNSNIISNSNSDSTSSSSSNSKIYALNNINITNTNLIDNSNNGLINAGNNINIVNNNILNNENGLIVLSSRSNYSNTNTNTNTSSTSNTSSTTTSPKITIDTRTSLNNTNGSIVSNGSAGDIDINVLTDYIINGTLYSNNNININAKNIKNYSDVISANNITFTANNGNIYNGSESTNATIITMNDIIFNILKDGNNTGSLYNYGKISANNNIEINAEDSVYNGLTTGSNATITANNNLTITANNRIINKGYIQAVGLTDRNTSQKIQGTGNLVLTTNAEINDDYDLGNSTSSLDNLLNKANEISSNNETISPEIQAKLDNIDNITDYNELDNLLKEVKTEEQYYLVQSRIRILKIKDALKEIEEDYLFNPEDWTLGNEVIVDYEYNEEIGEETEVKDTLTEELLQTRLQALLQDNYDYEDWDITAKLAEAEQNIGNEIQAQNERYVQYNQTQKQLAKENYNAQKEQAREQYIQDNGNDDGFNYEPFEWTDYTLEQYVNNNQDIETNGIIDNAKKQTILQETESNLKSQRFNEIKSIITSQQEKAANGLNNIDWNKLTNEQLQEQLSDILGNNYDSIKWSINDYNDANPLTAITNEYLAALRIDNIDTNKTEQTGIHNYGRLYSNNNSEFNSNSVLHNNKGSLIYSNNDINFNINKVLFNNENNLGQGIFANNNINIRGYKSNSTSKIFNNDGAKNTNWGTGTNKNTSTGNYYSAEKLINYDGLIEANNNIEILADDIINYGSDSIDLTKIDNTIKEKNKYYAYLPRKRGFGRGYYYRWVEVNESTYNYYVNGGTYTYSNQTITPQTRKDFQYYYVDETPELKAAYTLEYHHIRNAGLYETIMKGYDVAVSNQTSNSSTIKSNNSNINIRANNTTNYNSLIFANNNLNIETDNLLNKHSQINVNALQYWQYKGKKCKHGRWGCKTYYNDWTSRVVLQLEGTQPSQILAKGNLNIIANAIGNGTIQSNSDYSNNSNRIPYTQQTAPETNINIDNILNSGTINPLDFITTNNNNLSLPQGNYGIFRQPTNPNSHYLFETDPTLIDTDIFLGSRYFMNRIGLDPDTIDLKFLGDSYFEHELIRKTIEQQSLLTNTHLDPQQVKDKIDSLYNSMTQEKAQQLNLTIGEPLTEQQRNQLTEDTIWYIKQEITLPNGETYTALVPQIFYCNTTLARLEQERILNTAGSMLAGTNVILQTKPNSTDNINNTDNTDDTIFNTILSNSGTITAKNTLAITGFDTISNITSSIRNDDINSLSQDKFNNQATLTAGNTLIIDTGVNGTVNNLSGMIALNNTNDNTSSTQNSLYDNLLYINTGTLNNITLSQQETVEKQTHSKKNDYEFSKTSTYIGDTAAIQSSNNNSNIIINANEDINILGGDIKTTIKEQDNSNIVLNAGNNINIAAIQDYEYQRQYMRRKGGTFGETLEKENINQSVKNIQSNISAGNNLSITTGNNLNSIGTNFTANNGDIDLNIKNDLNLYNAMDYVYDYDYTKRESFDLAGAITNIVAAVAVGALTGGVGAAVMAGASAATGAANMTKGSIDIDMKYDEKVIGNSLASGNNININTGNNATLISTELAAKNSINANTGNELLIGIAQEKHESYSKHETWGGDLGMAALGGAMTGLAGGLGMGAGNFIGGSLTGLAMSGASAFGSSNVGAVISENLKGTSNGTYTTNQIGSDITALNNIDITTNNNLNIAGSDLTSGNDTTLTSNNGSVNILAAIETQTTEESKTKTNWKCVDFTHTNSSVGVGASVERNTTSNTTTTQYAKSSNIQSGNNITINSSNNNDLNNNPDNTNKQNINIIGSNIIAENDIKLNADNGDINVVSQELLQDVLDRQKTETITASVGITNYWVKAGDQANNIIKNSKGGARDNGTGYANTFFDLGNVGMSVANAVNSPLGFGVSADISYTNTETNTSQNNTYNQSSNIISNKGNIDLTAENDINIKGSTIATNNADNQENKGNINITSNNGDINITASKDTTNVGSDTHSNSVDIDLSLIPTYSYNDSETTIEQTRYNNSIISANGNNSKINIESKNKDINIKGANIEVDDDINLLAQNGNMNIESNQDRYYSNTDTKGFQIGGTIGFNLGKDYQEDITNNYTTIKSNNGNTNINTNDLALVGINEETKNNLNIQEQIANGNIKGNTTETQLQEKHDSEYYDLGVSYSLPVSIGNLNQKVNNALSNTFEKLANTLKDTDSTAGELLGAGITKLNTPPTTKDPLQPKTDSQSIINSGDWANSWKNTTVSYRDDNGFDFTASPNSVAMSGKITKKGIIYGSSGADYIFEQLYKLPGLKEGQFGRDVVGIVAAPFTVFGEQGSYLRNRDGKVRQEDIASAGTSYQVPGQTTGEKGAEYIINTLDNDSVVRVNPTDGGIGDTIKSGMMKILNITGLSDMVAMNRYVAKDKYIIATSENNTIRNMNFHSQGTIIDQGSNRVFLKEYPNTIMPTTNSLGEKINYNIQGYAIYPNITEGLYNKVSDNTINREADNLHMVRNPNDPIQQFAAPTLSSNPITFIINNFNSPNPIIIFDNLKKSFGSHSLDNQIYDNNRSVINIKKRIEINDKRGIPTKTDKNNGTKYIGLPDIK